jgi:3-oxoacyl-[acyl-carrier-protein] synthase II
MTDKKRVVITGLGAVSALGFGVDSLWQNMIEGKTGIGTITSMDLTGFKTSNGAEVDSEQLTSELKSRKLKAIDRTVDFALLAAEQALCQSGLISPEPPWTPQDISTLFGTGQGSSHSIWTTYSGFATKGLRGVRPTSVPRCMGNATPSQISMRFKLTGPNYATVSACASGTVAMGMAFRLIQSGYIKTALVGGSEAPIEPASFASWNNLGVMSKNADPTKACRPFDVNRDGCVLGEGSGALVMESLESAEQRGAEILVELLGYGESSDATHITSPSPEGQAKAIMMALSSAGIDPSEVGFVNAHGTATKANDTCESQSIRIALGKAADTALVASNKSFLGHTLGASGALETIATILGLRNGKVPPNLNLDDPDPECNVNLVGNSATDISSPIAIKNSFGFGGNNAVIVLRRFNN